MEINPLSVMIFFVAARLTPADRYKFNAPLAGLQRFAIINALLFFSKGDGVSVFLFIFGEICLIGASYVSSLAVIYFLNKFTFMFPFDPFSYLACPISANCVEFGYEYKNWVLIGTGIIFLISGIIAPLVYYKKSS